MDYIIIILLIVLIILVIISISKNINEANITERLGNLEKNTIKELGEFKSQITKDQNDNFSKLNNNLHNDFVNLNDKMEEKLRLINDKVNERIDENFEKTNKTFNNVLERLTKIDEAQKKIDNLSSDIVSLQNILTDKKTRGTFGEVNLNNILLNIFGENKKLYQIQFKLSNERVADAMIFAPEPLGKIAVDSKFPLENYQRMMDKKIPLDIREKHEKLFKMDLKKHIDDISNKYIIRNETSNQAIMFLPAEAIFAHVTAYYEDVIAYAQRKRVWITSPTTLISTLTTIQLFVLNLERDKNAEIIHKELNLLGDEFKRYKERWDKLSRSIDTVSKDVKDIHTTTDKITNKFEKISNNQINTQDLLN